MLLQTYMYIYLLNTQLRDILIILAWTVRKQNNLLFTIIMHIIDSINSHPLQSNVTYELHS